MPVLHSFPREGFTEACLALRNQVPCVERGTPQLAVLSGSGKDGKREMNGFVFCGLGRWGIRLPYGEH